jgi:uncharacterized protein YgbK (DUF1537 family)
VTRWLIVADDLTGAADSAAPFAASSSVAVAVAPEMDWPETDVVAVVTDSRYSPPEVATARVTAAVRRAASGGARVFKKIDSLLRGNVAVEVRAAANALGGPGRPALAVVAAAFPATGRITRGGAVHVAGRQLTGRHSGDIAALLAETGLTAERAGLAQVRNRGLTAHFAQSYEAGIGAVVCDGETDADLAAVAEAAERAGHPVLLVGTGGLAHALSGEVTGPGRAPERAIGSRTGRPKPASSTGWRPGGGPALTVIGSYADEAQAQRRALLADGWTPVMLPADGAAVRRALARGYVVLSPDPDLPVEHAIAPGIARELAAATAVVACDVALLAVTGGETAQAVLGALGATEIHVLGELEPGVVAGRLPGYAALFVTKAGAFGDAGTLVRVLSPTPATMK